MKYDPNSPIQFSEKKHFRSEQSLQWYHIAAGVFVALMGYAIITGLYKRYEERKQAEQIMAELDKFNAQMERELKEIRSVPVRRMSPPKPLGTISVRGLADDERCMSGVRLKRTESGWEQIGSC